MKQATNFYNLMGLPRIDFDDINTDPFVVKLFEHHTSSRKPHTRDKGSILDGEYKKTTSGLPCKVVIHKGVGYIQRSDGLRVKLEDKTLTIFMLYASSIRIYWPVRYCNFSIRDIVFCIGRGNPLSLARLVYALYNGELPTGGSAHYLVDDTVLLEEGLKPELIGIRNEWVTRGSPVDGIQYISGALVVGRKPIVLGIPTDIYSIVKGKPMSIGKTGLVYLDENKKRWPVPNWYMITGLPDSLDELVNKKLNKRQQVKARADRLSDRAILRQYQ